MNNHLWPRIALAVFASGLIAAPRAGAQQSRYRNVEARDLVERPQNYWARPIVFQDTLLQPPSGRDFKLEGIRYATFTTKTIGTCYLVKPLESVLAQVPADRDYVFSGTVLQRGGRYYVIVESFSGTVDSEEIPSDLRNVAASGKALLVSKSTQPMADILRTSQESLFAYAKEHNLKLEQLFEPDSGHSARAMELIRMSAREQEKKLGTPSAEIIAQYVYGVLVQNQQALQTPAEPALDEAVEEEEAPADEESVAAEPVQPAPPKLSWWQRRAQDRAQKAALKAEQERQAQESWEVEEEEPQEEVAAPDEESPPDSPVPAVAPEPEEVEPPVIELPPPQQPADLVPADSAAAPESELAPAETNTAPPAPTRAERRELDRQQKAALKAERELAAAEKKAQARREKEAAEAARREAEEAGRSGNQIIPMFKTPGLETESPETSLENPTKPYFAPPGE